ncbi:hypothetical protein [Altererythrobacter aquiaggeris]|uniref:hypothetical protein n=1 Tax=Aestuarierythrobacter aquiaggeris TaxID=1898396 RepID=UPI003016BC5D
MSEVHARLAEDRAIRDAARAVFTADLANLKDDIKDRGVGARMKDRIGETAADMMEEAVDMAAENKGLLGALGAALALWFGRFPILVALGLAEAEDSGENHDYNSGAEDDD